MIYVFYFLAAVLVFLSYRSFRGGIDYLTFFRTELAKPRSDFTPFATIFAPCRGVDEGMKENLEALLLQDYPAYEVVFVVDDRDDPAVIVIDGLLDRRGAAESQRINFEKDNKTGLSVVSASLRLYGENKVSARLAVAPKADGCSQKVENLREAVLHADDASEIFVFVDSDTRPSREWLRGLTAPLSDETVGAATGYRWFITRDRSLGSEMRSAWNASIATALGPNRKTNFCWGGSTAIRRKVFERLDIRERWRGTLSDDFAMTRALNDAKLPIVFVPAALTASVEDCSFGEMLEFTTRQMKITRVYAPHLWIMSFVGSGLFNAVLAAAALIVVLERPGSFRFWFALATLMSVTFFSVGKSWLRLRAVRLVMNGYGRELDGQFWAQNTLWLLTPAVFFYNSFLAWISRRMTWRGTTYELKSRSETVIIAD